MRHRAACPATLLAGVWLFLAPAVPTTALATGATGQAAQAPAAALVTAADQSFTRDGVTLRYKEAGSGEPIVLIHGYAATLESMASIGQPLTPSYRVVAMDVRGFGKSSKFGEPARFGPQLVEDVVRLMDHLEIKRAHLIGHSMGALIAANVAERHADRVISATLIAAPFYPDRASFAKEAARWVSDLEAGHGLTNFLQWLFPKMDPKMAAFAGAQAVKSNDLPSLIAVLRSLPELAIARISSSVPTFVIVGTGDPLHPLSVRFAKASKAASYQEVVGADHVNIAATPELTRGMRELLQRSTAGTKQMH